MQYENRGKISYMKPHHHCFRAQNLHTALLLYPVPGDSMRCDIKVRFQHPLQYGSSTIQGIGSVSTSLQTRSPAKWAVIVTASNCSWEREESPSRSAPLLPCQVKILGAEGKYFQQAIEHHMTFSLGRKNMGGGRGKEKQKRKGVNNQPFKTNPCACFATKPSNPSTALQQLLQIWAITVISE